MLSLQISEPRVKRSPEIVTRTVGRVRGKRLLAGVGAGLWGALCAGGLWAGVYAFALIAQWLHGW